MREEDAGVVGALTNRIAAKRKPCDERPCAAGAHCQCRTIAEEMVNAARAESRGVALIHRLDRKETSREPYNAKVVRANLIGHFALGVHPLCEDHCRQVRCECLLEAIKVADLLLAHLASLRPLHSKRRIALEGPPAPKRAPLNADEKRARAAAGMRARRERLKADPERFKEYRHRRKLQRIERAERKEREARAAGNASVELDAR